MDCSTAATDKNEQDSTTDTTEADKVRQMWIPLESNPDVFNQYSRLLGSHTGTWLDIPSFDPESLSFIPPPVVAVIFLYATTPQFDQGVKQEDEMIAKSASTPANTFFMKQTIRNACGSIALLHSLANNQELLQEEGLLKRFIDQSSGLDPLAKGLLLESNQAIREIHHSMATSGQTRAPPPELHADNHFVAFVHKNGRVVELSGGRPGPIDHGATNEGDFLNDAVNVCKMRMEKIMGMEDRNKSAEEYKFAVFCLTTAFTEED